MPDPVLAGKGGWHGSRPERPDGLLLSLKERVDDEVDAVYERHGYVVDGEPSRGIVEDKVYDLVSAAVVEKRAERGKVAVTSRSLMATVFPQVAGPEAWAEQEDPELAEGVYGRLDGHLWRLVNWTPAARSSSG